MSCPFLRLIGLSSSVKDVLCLYRTVIMCIICMHIMSMTMGMSMVMES